MGILTSINIFLLSFPLNSVYFIVFSVPSGFQFLVLHCIEQQDRSVAKNAPLSPDLAMRSGVHSTVRPFV